MFKNVKQGKFINFFLVRKLNMYNCSKMAIILFSIAFIGFYIVSPKAIINIILKVIVIIIIIIIIVIIIIIIVINIIIIRIIMLMLLSLLLVKYCY